PNPARVAEANLTAFMLLAAERSGTPIPDFAALHRWSIASPAEFWSLLWDYAGVIAETRGETVLVDGDRMPGARFFPHSRLSCAETVLRGRGRGAAIVFRGEDKVRRRLSHDDLNDQVSRLAQAMRGMGIRPGDRVAGFVPNMPETIVATLAAASLGAIWSSC